MEAVRKTYVVYIHPDGSEADEQEVSSRDPLRIPVPPSAAGFYLFDRVEATTDEGILLTSEPQDVTPRYLIDMRQHGSINDMLITRWNTHLQFLWNDVFLRTKRDGTLTYDV
jgi:hypothetical protein